MAELLINVLLLLTISDMYSTVEIRQEFESKRHGIRTELADHVTGNFSVVSKIGCGVECQQTICDLFYYSNVTNECILYNAYMSDDQPAEHDLYVRVGAVDKKPCQPLPAPTDGTVIADGNMYGDVANYECVLGKHMVTGDPKRTCGEGGVWSGMQPTCESVGEREYTTEISVGNGGPFGDWGQSQFCQNGAYAYGYSLKIDPPGGDADETGLNGIKLHCRTLNGTQIGDDITSLTERVGSWSGFADCNDHDFVTGFVLQLLKHQGSSDDTMANFVKVKCRDLAGTDQPYEVAVPPGYGPWGKYGSWSNQCDLGTVVCGLQTLVEEFVISSATFDDTALNDVIMFCCS